MVPTALRPAYADAVVLDIPPTLLLESTHQYEPLGSLTATDQAVAVVPQSMFAAPTTAWVAEISWAMLDAVSAHIAEPFGEPFPHDPAVPLEVPYEELLER